MSTYCCVKNTLRDDIALQAADGRCVICNADTLCYDICNVIRCGHPVFRFEILFDHHEVKTFARRVLLGPGCVCLYGLVDVVD